MEKGQTTGHGAVITAAINNEAIADLGPTVGDEATAVIKVSYVRGTQ